MRTAPRATRRTTAAQPPAGKENGTVTPTPSRKARHRLSIAQLARLEDAFRQQTHPPRQQKKDLAAELGMDYKTITIWFQNKRQTSKRAQLPAEAADGLLGRARADSGLRSVSSPSHNATLDAPAVAPTAHYSESKGLGLASKAIVKIQPLLDTLNVLASRPKERMEPTEAMDEAPKVEDIGPHHSIPSPEFDRRGQIAEQAQTKEKLVGWKRLRTLEWACERQAKRRKLSKEGYTRLGSEDVQDGDPNTLRTESALSLLSLASSTNLGPPKDVMRGASLLLSFKHSWRRK